MTARTAVGLCLVALASGLIFGWTLRAHTTGDRYINALATRMIAENTYFEERTDQIIRMNEPKQYAVVPQEGPHGPKGEKRVKPGNH